MRGPDGKPRCGWPGTDEMRTYHDREWGTPKRDDRRHFRFLVLESAQSGLSWSLIWRKREGYRKAFADFDPRKVARFDARMVERLLRDDGIVRNRRKVTSAVRNARAFLALQREFGSFDTYIWGFAPKRRPAPRTLGDLPARTAESEALARDMKERGFSFLGPVVMYSHLQAVGVVNDHVVGCFRRVEIERMKMSERRAALP
ncbi:MAG: DNA-3-methyladenine glycosylase I [Candidatus Limnocylindria bacterium]